MVGKKGGQGIEEREEGKRPGAGSRWSPHRPEEAGGGWAVGQGAPRRCLPRGGRNKGLFCT
jgi:hypothetical protein